MIVEGQQVAYAGDTDPFNEVGSLGKVVAMSGAAAHVQWTTGPKAGSIDLVETYELVERRTASTAITRDATTMGSFDAALDMPATETISVRATYDDTGEDGLVTALNEAGHLAVLAEYVDEAVGHLASRIRGDLTLGEVLAQLEQDEAESLVARVASVLLNDRLGEA